MGNVQPNSLEIWTPFNSDTIWGVKRWNPFESESDTKPEGANPPPKTPAEEATPPPKTPAEEATPPLQTPAEETTPEGEKPKPKCKACCACPETRKIRDECIFEFGEEKCLALIEAHKQCLRDQGFKI